MDIPMISSFFILAAALFLGTRRSGLMVKENQIKNAMSPASPEDVVEDFYSTYLENENPAHKEARLQQFIGSRDSRHTQIENQEWAWPVLSPEDSRPRGILVENARVDGDRALVPVRAGYLGPAGEMDFRLKFGVLMEKIDGQWLIAGTYRK
jgi:hypothetical protein